MAACRGQSVLAPTATYPPNIIEVTATPQGVPLIPSVDYDFIPDDAPNLAGVIAGIAPDSITLRTGDQERTLPFAPEVGVMDSLGQLVGVNGLVQWQEAVVWAEGNPPQAQIIRILSPVAALEADQPDIGQPEPTGEIRYVGNLPMVTRAGWGAAPFDVERNPEGEFGMFDPESNPTGWMFYQDDLADALTTLIVHHSALSMIDGPRTIQAFHMANKGFADIAYHFVIDGFGTLYEGRVLHARGAHTGGGNTGTVGVVLLGNFNIVPLLREQLSTLGQLATYLASEYVITHLAGHRDFQPRDTECPGQYLHAVLPDIATELTMLYGTGGYVVPDWQAN